MASKIKILDPIEHIRKYPGMYIGSTTSPHHLLQEVLDNALDELINGYATKLKIVINNSEVIIADNGRGIPVHEIKVNGKEEDSVVVACTTLLSGSKFEKDAYKFSIGMHGIGLVAVNALSDYLEIFTKVGDKKYNHYKFEKSKLKYKDIIELKDRAWSTIVKFAPNQDYFETLDFDLERLFDQLTLVKFLFPKCQVELEANEQNFKIENISFEEFIKYHFGQTNETLSTIQYSYNSLFSLNLVVQFSENSKFVGYVNLKKVDGRYKSALVNLLYKILQNNGIDLLTRTEVERYLQILTVMFLDQPHFDSQSKNFLTNNIAIYISDQFIDDLEETIKKKGIIERFKILNEEKRKKSISKKLRSKKRASAENPLIDARVEGRVLYIVEGESAGGTIQEIIDNRYEGVLPLTGKILNVIKKKNIEDIVDSKKIRNLIEAIGINPVDHKKSDYRYKQIKILADADPDGYHIVILALLSLLKFAPDLIEEGRVSVILPPLYGATVKGKFIPIYRKEEISKYSNVKRFKGLGEMNPEELETVIRDPKYEYVVQYPNKYEYDALIKIVLSPILKQELSNKIEVSMMSIFN